MRIIFYLIAASLIFTCFSSCSKGDIVKNPQFGNISIVTSSLETFDIVQGDHNKFIVNAKAVSMVSGKNRFRFYLKDILVKDTLLSVSPFKTQTYTLFKPDEDSNVRIFDSSFNGLDKEVLPDSGFVKFSLVNFSKSLPDKVDVYISTTTYIPFSEKPIQVGEFLNITRSFSEFHTLMVGVNQSSQAMNKFTLTIKNSGSNLTLATIPLVLPISATAGNLGKLTGSIYFLYLGNNNTVDILMSK